MTNELGEKGRGELVSQYIGKIAEFRYPDQITVLNLIKHPLYKKLLRFAIQDQQSLSNRDFVDMIFSLGRIHQYEMGIVHKKLFNVLMKKIQ